MNNSKFMELSNEEIMEVEGGVICTTCALIAIGCGVVGAGVGMFAAYRSRKK